MSSLNGYVISCYNESHLTIRKNPVVFVSIIIGGPTKSVGTLLYSLVLLGVLRNPLFESLLGP